MRSRDLIGLFLWVVDCVNWSRDENQPLLNRDRRAKVICIGYRIIETMVPKTRSCGLHFDLDGLNDPSRGIFNRSANHFGISATLSL